MIILILGSAATFLIQRWVDRPQLFVAVEEVGFVGSDDYVEVGTVLRDLSEEDRWFTGLERFVKWSALNDRYENIRLRQGRLELAIAIVEEWRQRESRSTIEGQMSRVELSDYPYVRDEIYSLFGAILRDSIRRGELGIAPIEISRVVAEDVVAEYAKDSDKWRVYGDTWVVVFGSSGMIAKEQLLESELVVKSLGHGIRVNLVYYADRFVEIASKDVRHLKKIESELIDILYPQTRVFARVTVFNAGNRPAVMEPYGVLMILNEGIGTSGLLMRASPGISAVQERFLLEMEGYSDVIEGLAGDTSDELSRQVEVVPLLPVKGSVQYVMVPLKGKRRLSS